MQGMHRKLNLDLLHQLCHCGCNNHCARERMEMVRTLKNFTIPRGGDISKEPMWTFVVDYDCCVISMSNVRIQTLHETGSCT